MTKVMVDSLAARGLLQGVQNYVGLVMQVSAKHEAIGCAQDIVRKEIVAHPVRGGPAQLFDECRVVVDEHVGDGREEALHSFPHKPNQVERTNAVDEMTTKTKIRTAHLRPFAD